MKSSISRQVYIRLVLSLLTIWLIVVISVTMVVRHESNEIFDAGLQETAQRLLILTLKERAMAQVIGVVETPDHLEYLSFQLTDDKGNLLVRSHSAPASRFPTPLKSGSYTVEKQHFRVESSRDRRFFMTIAERTGHRESTLADVLLYLLLPLVALIPLTGAALYFSLRLAKRSLAALDRELAGKNSLDLQAIALTSQPMELHGLISSVNALMNRLRLALEAERNFTANSAHELRTPIASALAQLDVLLAGSQEAAARERIMNARGHLERLHQTMVKLLQLARAESGIALDLVDVDLGALARLLIDDMAHRSARKIQFQCPDQPVIVPGDLDAIGIAIVNLLENADKYAVERSEIEVVVDAGGSIMIRNDCAALDPATMQVILDRFSRGDQRSVGSGIGLSIVNTIAAQCQARLVVKSPQAGSSRGFEAGMIFPLRPEARLGNTKQR